MQSIFLILKCPLCCSYFNLPLYLSLVITLNHSSHLESTSLPLTYIMNYFYSNFPFLCILPFIKTLLSLIPLFFFLVFGFWFLVFGFWFLVFKLKAKVFIFRIRFKKFNISYKPLLVKKPRLCVRSQITLESTGYKKEVNAPSLLANGGSNVISLISLSIAGKSLSISFLFNFVTL